VIAWLFPVNIVVAMTKAGLRDFIAQRSLAVLATTSPTGLPQSALVGIAVTNELEIIFDTVASSRKYRNLIHNSAAALVIGWTGEATVQYEGVVTRPVGEELERYKEVYFAKLPDCVSHQSWPDIAYFAVRPKWIRYSDYDQQPAIIEEFTF
jgi:pyridoxine/pyridoxamine 5'-phosphate oxidase